MQQRINTLTLASNGGTAVLDAPPPQPQPATTAPVAASGGSRLKKVSFGIQPKKEDSKKAYPIFPHDDNVMEITSRIAVRQAQFDALEGALKTDKAELKQRVAPHYFKVNHGRTEVPSSVSVQLFEGLDLERKCTGEVLVTFQNRYPQISDESAIAALIDDQSLETYFGQTFELKIKGDLGPAASAQDLVNEVQAIFAKYNCADALELKEGIKPTADFHLKRHSAFSPEVNVALEQVCPIVAQVKTKGRK